ncbi:putative FAD dependent oxidoreductase [Aspergillus nomiae NRRL 13137]|uniref:Putative FAD dependent oxidoreductase n=1 Tax=Aspergillus nomiae NRRL (strain ATCC 15546 / NRRL 13137 / CBS 260.88 / M93) TaxID=1509407 RepID=A0A0L1IRI7_ASPN3|nr:putative FAD dependent oxidoreductase [Aspergillus nomiae NRRL 13137]KNG81975.1 putative FAD dependent oxidoreductase [Aspergillus nomiae NRRL 13137]
MTTSPYSLSSPLTQPQPVIVVGSGLAGLSAATQLISHQVPVIMLDRAEKPGGNSIKASSGINGAPTRFQPGDADDSRELFLADTVKSAGDVFANSPAEEHRRRESLMATVTASSAEAVYWLTDEKGVDLSTVSAAWDFDRQCAFGFFEGEFAVSAAVGGESYEGVARGG